MADMITLDNDKRLSAALDIVSMIQGSWSAAYRDEDLWVTIWHHQWGQSNPGFNLSEEFYERNMAGIEIEVWSWLEQETRPYGS